MGNLINPISARLGSVKYWNSTWSVTSQSYSQTILLNVNLVEYLKKLFKIINKMFTHRFPINLIDYKIIQNNKEVYIIVYFRLFVGKSQIQRKLKTFTNSDSIIFFRESAILQQTLNTIVRTRGGALTVWYNNRTGGGKGQEIKEAAALSAYTNFKFKSWQQKNSTFSSRKFSKLSKQNKVKSKKIARQDLVKIAKRLSKYDFRRIQAFPLAQLFNSILSATDKYELLPKHSRNKIKEKTLAEFAEPLRDYIFYRRYFSQLRFFIRNVIQKFLITSSLRVVFMKYSENSITASIVTKYITKKLKLGFPVRPLINKFVAYMRRETQFGNLHGFKIICSGRFARRGRASYMWRHVGKVPNTNFELDLDYDLRLVVLVNSICAVKLWLAKPQQAEKKMCL